MIEQDSDGKSATIRALNDAFRTSLTGGAVLMTAGIIGLGPEVRARILAAVRAFNEFSTDNDPWAEHDFGAVELDGERIFFKIDYFDPTRARHSADPADPTVTERVMTIMLASEY